METTSSEKENYPTPLKKRRISLSLKGRKNAQEQKHCFDRFVTATESDVEKAKEGVLPANTQKMNAWALRNFDAWKAATNKKHPDKQEAS